MPESYNVKYLCKFGKAKVVIDDKIQGTTPFETKLSRGQHIIKAYLSGYKDFADGYFIDRDHDYYIRMEPGKSSQETEPKPKFHIIRFICNQGAARIFIDGNFQGTSTLKYKLEDKLHSVEAHLEGYNDFSDGIYVNKDQDYYINMTKKEQEKEPVTNPLKKNQQNQHLAFI